MQAGVSASLLHYHFASRDSLLAEALEHSYELAGDIRTQPRRQPAAAPERLRGMIDHCLPLPGRLHDDWMLWVELWLHAGRRPELRPTAARLYARLHEWFSKAIAEGEAGGEFVVERPRPHGRPPARAARRLRHPRADRRLLDRAGARGDLGGDRAGAARHRASASRYREATI